MKLLLAALCLALPASAQDNRSHVKAELISEQSALKPGDRITIGLRMQMEDGWHTYWRNPGDSGLATAITWKLPPGFKAGELQWPVPERLNGYKSVTYIYNKEAILLTDISAPAKLDSPTPTIAGHVTWLECKDVCVQGEADVSLSFPAMSAKSRIAMARKRVPVRPGEGPAAGWRVGAAVKNGIVALIVMGADAPKYHGDFFPYDNSVVDNAKPGESILGDRRVLDLNYAAYPVAKTAKRLTGVLINSRLITEQPGPSIEVSVPIAHRGQNAPEERY